MSRRRCWKGSRRTCRAAARTWLRGSGGGSWPPSGGLLLSLTVGGREAGEVLAQALETAGKGIDVLVRPGLQHARERGHHPAVRLAQHLPAGARDRDELGAAVAVVLAALDEALGGQRGDLAAGDRQVDAEVPGDLADAQRAVHLEDGERGEALGAELGQRVAADVPLHHAEAVELADE